jgi:hypothetical protein
MSSLTDYLAKNYLSADRKPDKKSKKRKQKDREGGESGLLIADDDATAWGSSRADGEDDDMGVPVTGENSLFPLFRLFWRRRVFCMLTTAGFPAL